MLYYVNVLPTWKEYIELKKKRKKEHNQADKTKPTGSWEQFGIFGVKTKATCPSTRGLKSEDRILQVERAQGH